MLANSIADKTPKWKQKIAQNAKIVEKSIFFLIFFFEYGGNVSKSVLLSLTTVPLFFLPRAAGWLILIKMKDY